MVEERKDPPIIIVKKNKRGHGGHHGGAWKVAYADFVTAMMAFFLVMWLVNQSDPVKQAVGGYFRDPVMAGKGAGVLEGGAAPKIGPDQSSAIDSVTAVALERIRQHAERSVRRQLAQAGVAIKQLIDESPELRELGSQLEIQMTEDGLRIQMVEPGEGEAFFPSGNANLTPKTERILGVIAGRLQKLPNHIVVEGHTDSLKYASGSRYTNWELSADRANTARAALESGGVEPGKVFEIRGYAANQPRFPDNPADPRNRRVSILVLNDFDRTAYEHISFEGRSFEYSDRYGYREQFDSMQRANRDPS